MTKGATNRSVLSGGEQVSRSCVESPVGLLRVSSQFLLSTLASASLNSTVKDGVWCEAGSHGPTSS